MWFRQPRLPWQIVVYPMPQQSRRGEAKAGIPSHDSVEHVALPLAGHHSLPPSVGAPEIVRVRGISAVVRLQDGLRDRGQGPGLLIAVVVSGLRVVSKPIILIGARIGGMA